MAAALPRGRGTIRAMFPSEPKEPTRSDATEDASRLGELKNATRGYAQIEADRETACTRNRGHLTTVSFGPPGRGRGVSGGESSLVASSASKAIPMPLSRE